MTTETNPDDWRVILAAEHPEWNLRPPVLEECAHPGCTNTVVAGEETHCRFHR